MGDKKAMTENLCTGDIAAMQQMIAEWANKQFPNRSVELCLRKLREELEEALEKPQDETELADMAILIFDLFYLLNKDLGTSVTEKMKINMGREWAYDSIQGVWNHVDEN